jgi:hypothetical protein
MLVKLRETGEVKDFELCKDFPNLIQIKINGVVIWRTSNGN